MSQTNLQSAVMVGEKITEKMMKFIIKAPNGNNVTLGISGGIAVYPNHGRTATELLRAADEALYRAKRHDRGRFVAAKGLTARLASNPSHAGIDSETTGVTNQQSTGL